MGGINQDGTYYDRTMSDEIVKDINEYDWLIPYVKKKKSLDFQTGHDPKTGRSWFSVYRGTSRVLTLRGSDKGPFSWEAAGAYKDIAPANLFKKPTKELFKEYLSKIRKESKFYRYYEAPGKKEKKEGYYQNLIGRRYTFEGKESDDFIIIDKEFVLGFKDDATKAKWNGQIVSDLKKEIEQFRQGYKGELPKQIKNEYGEFDFLALNKKGDILIMELKQNDPSKTALSPIQVCFYYRQLGKFLKSNLGDVYKSIKSMVKQKQKLGLIHSNFTFPNKLSGNIVPCVIVGEESKLSDEMCTRFSLAKKTFLPWMKAYSCVEDGTLYEINIEETFVPLHCNDGCTQPLQYHRTSKGKFEFVLFEVLGMGRLGDYKSFDGAKGDFDKVVSICQSEKNKTFVCVSKIIVGKNYWGMYEYSWNEDSDNNSGLLGCVWKKLEDCTCDNFSEMLKKHGVCYELVIEDVPFLRISYDASDTI